MMKYIHRTEMIPEQFELYELDRRTDREILDFQGKAAEALVALLKNRLRQMNGGLLPDQWTQRLVRIPATRTDEMGTVTYRFNKRLLLRVTTTIQNNVMSITMFVEGERKP